MLLRKLVRKPPHLARHDFWIGAPYLAADEVPSRTFGKLFKTHLERTEYLGVTLSRDDKAKRTGRVQRIARNRRRCALARDDKALPLQVECDAADCRTRHTEATRKRHLAGKPFLGIVRPGEYLAPQRIEYFFVPFHRHLLYQKASDGSCGG